MQDKDLPIGIYWMRSQYSDILMTDLGMVEKASNKQLLPGSRPTLDNKLSISCLLIHIIELGSEKIALNSFVYIAYKTLLM